MADYGIGRSGGSLRDALNELYPMSGLGEYNTAYPPMMFPPASGADQPSAAVPLPQSRPPMAPQGLSPGALNIPQPAPYGGPQQNRFVPGLPGYPGVPAAGPPMQRPPLPGYPPPDEGLLTRPPLPGAPMQPSGLTRPPLPQGGFAPGGNYAARLLGGQY